MTLPYSAVRGSASFRILILASMPVFLFFTAFGQVPSDILVETPTQTGANAPLLVSVELLHGEAIERMNLQYRSFGSSEYTRLEMDMRGNRASALIPAADVRPPFIEYYIVLETRGGTVETYPLSEGGDPYSRPPEKTLQVSVRTGEERDRQVIFLSPEPNGLIEGDELVISVSLLRADTSVDRQATRLFLDGADITQKALFSDDLIVYAPENFAIPFRPGRHTLTVRLFDRSGNLHTTTSISFTAVAAGPEDRSPDIRYHGSLQTESRFERIAGAGAWFNRGTATLDATTGNWYVRSNVFLTSEESAGRQPQNRYFIGIESPWAKVGYGDGFPAFPSLVLNGKRVRGFQGSVVAGMFNLDMTLGKTARGVEGQIVKLIGVDTLALEQQRDPAASYAPIDQFTWGKFSYGTFERSLFAIRPSFASEGNWKVGFTWLKSKDQMQSIRYGVSPQENLVVGTDFVVKALDNAVELSGQGAFSAFNADISSGNFTDAYIDSVYPNDAAGIKRARDILDDFITVNDNLRPLSFKRLATLAYELGLGVELPKNSVRATYLSRGSEYNSFGQTFLRKDIRGFNIVDRIRALSDRVFMTLGYERLRDNTSKTKSATTVFSNINAAVSCFPGSDLPSFTVGYSYFSSDNDLLLADPNVIDERTHRVYTQSSYGFQLGVRHSLDVGYSSSVRDDRSVREFDIKNSTFSIGLLSQFTIPLQTRVDYSLNLNSIPYEFDYSTLALSGKYAVVPNAITLSSSFSPTFGDVQRVLASFGSEWAILETVTVLLDFNYFHLRSRSDDVIWNARLRYDL